MIKRFLRRFTAPRERASDARADAGETLVEVLLALIILSLASVAMITAFATDISASAEHRSLANFDTVLASSLTTTASAVQGAVPSVFASCSAPYPDLTHSLGSLSDGGVYTATIAASGSQPAVEYFDGSTFSPTCTSSDVGNTQLINVVVTDTVTHYSQSNTVAVVDPTPVQIEDGQGGAPGGTLSLIVSTPVGGPLGSPLTVQPKVTILSDGEPLIGDDPVISLVLTPPTGGAALVGCQAFGAAGGVVQYNSCQVNQIGQGYTVTATLGSGPTALSATSGPFSISPSPLATPTITSVVPSTVTAGVVNVSFTTPNNAPSGQTYVAEACTDQGMTANCTTPATITSGGALTGLVAGTSYWVQVTATESANYLGATSPPFGPTMATVQLAAPTNIVLGYGGNAGSLSVSFTPPSTVAPGQSYTVKACTNNAMSSSCVSNPNVTSNSGTITGLTYTAGSVGSPVYYVQVLSNASKGYLASTAAPPTPVPGSDSHAATSQVKMPTGLSAGSSASQVGAITVTFSQPGGGPTPSSFTATACTDAAMTANCVSMPTVPPGAQLSGLTPGVSYYVAVTAVSTTQGYASSNTAIPSVTVATATAQLAAPTNVTLGYGSVAGSLTVSFTAPSPAAVGQTYTVKACTNAGMSTGCVTNANFPSGSSLGGLAFTVGSAGVPYFVQVTANGSSGYFVSPATTPVSGVDESEIGAPGIPVVTQGTIRGSIAVTFAASPGTVPSSYTAVACTGPGITGTCTSPQTIVSGGQITGLRSGTNYYVQVTAIGPAGYASNVSAVSARGAAR